MDANRDEAMKCIHIAKVALSNEDLAKAVKFLSKAEAMYPTDEAQRLLKACKAKEANPARHDARTKTSEQPKSPRATNGTSNSRGVPNGDRTNSDNAALNRECNRIITSKSYYDVLGVPRSATEDEIKRAYKKLALKFHPDKNPAKRAGEAFNKIAEAFQCLSDKDMRAHYDRFGREPGAPMDRGQAFQQGVYMTPDQLFEALFTMSTPGVYHNRHRHTANQQNTTHHGWPKGNASPTGRHPPPHLSPFFMVPFALMLILMFLTSFMGTESPAFQFVKSSKYSLMASTKLNGVIYYVDGGTFERNYPEKSQNRVRIEYEVDYNYFDTKCSQERQDNHDKAYSYVSRMKTPPQELYETPDSCKVLSNLRKRYEDYLRSGEYKQ